MDDVFVAISPLQGKYGMSEKYFGSDWDPPKHEIPLPPDEVDAKIREQIAAGVFPVRLSGDQWRSGEKIWLLDVIAPGKKIASAVLANFAQVTGGGQVNIHPVVTKQVDSDVLEKMTAQSK